MTLYLTLDAIRKGQLNLDSKLKFSAYAQEVSKVNKVNTLHVKEGDQMTVRQAIEAIVTRSYNEAAVLLAEGVAGDEWKFVALMNQKARELGGHVSLFRAADRSSQLRASLQDNPKTQALHLIENRLRATFDPDGVFATGRMN